MPSYDKDQVVLLVAEDSNFLRKCQVVLGTPTINQAIRAMKKSEMENAPEAWQSAQHAYEFANYIVQLGPEDYGMTMPTNTGENPTDLDELILLKNKTTIPAFESIILHCRTCRTMMIYDGSRNVSVVLHNLTGKLVHLPAGRPVAWVVAANAIPDATPSPEFL